MHAYQFAGLLTLDFTDQDQVVGPAALKASRRATTSSRAPGAVRRGTVYSRRVPPQRCAECGKLWDGAGVPGRHSVRAVDGRLVNCSGREVAP